MREAFFIKQNKDKWVKIEKEGYNDPSSDDLANNFIELTDDLSYAKTFYPDSQTEKYLNRLAGKYFMGIYKHRKREAGRFWRFWKEELPLVMYQRRKLMFYSFLFLLLGFTLGAFSASQDTGFVRLILGDSYVNQTLENIDKGDPMAVYKAEESAPMFLMISSNNIKVAFIAFIFGILFSIGSVYILFSNGVMLGAFQYFFYQKGLLTTSMLSIWLHGTLEISAIIIAGGAGLALGNSLLFPQSYPRLYALTKAAKDALKIVVGLIPVFIVAAFIESFLTRLTEIPIAFNLTIIGLSASFIGYYFFYYPYRVHLREVG
ncbi:stage II sporulation protein M [Viscerimonas tarda]